MRNKFTDYLGLGTPIWMQSRKSLFIFSCFDFLLFLLIKTKFFAINSSFRLLSFSILFSFLWCLISYINGRYSYFKDDKNKYQKIYKLLINTMISLCIIYIFEKLLIIRISDIEQFGRNSIFLIGLISFIIQSLKLIIFKNNYSKNKIFLLGGKESIQDFQDFIRPYIKNLNISIINLSNDNLHLLKNQSVVIFEEKSDNGELNYLYRNYVGLNLTILTPCKFCEQYLHKIPIIYLTKKEFQTNEWLVKSDVFQWRLKRFGDIFVSLILITLTFPILIFSALLIWMEDQGPIFYLQIRTGISGKEFKIIKLRTMKKTSEENGAVWAKKNDKRITNIGKILRRTRIDELPQLISVIIGDMSLIGPRPERPEIEIILKKNIPFYDLRHSIKPGLSGWAQVNYPYGASIIDSKIKLSYELFYIRNYSFFLDLLIFFKTIKMVINMKGSQPIK